MVKFIIKFIIILILHVLTILSGIFMFGLNVALGLGLILFGAILFIAISVIYVFYAIMYGKL